MFPSFPFRRYVVSSALGLLLLGALACTAAAQQNVRINDDVVKRRQESPALAIDSNGTMYVAWADYRAAMPERPQIYLSTSTDGGNSWSVNTRVSSDKAWPTGGMEMGPSLAVGPDGSVVTDWADIRRTPDWSSVDVSVARIAANVPPTPSELPRINGDFPRSQHQPAIAAGSDGTIYAVWHSFPKTGEKPATPVFLARSTDGGKTFESQRRIDTYDSAATARGVGSCNCCQPTIFTDGARNVYVAYRIDSADIRDIFLVKSTDRGATWSRAMRVSSGMWRFNACPGTGPRGFARNDTVYLTWMDNRENRTYPSVYVSRSTDAGMTFGPDVLVDTAASFPAISVDNSGRVFVLWSAQDTAGTLCAVSEHGGLTFGPKHAVNSGQRGSRNTEAACAGSPNGNIYCVWRDQSGDDGDIRFSNLTELAMIPSSIDAQNMGITSASMTLSPNPAAPGVQIVISLKRLARSIDIIDPLGRVVRRLDPGSMIHRISLTESGVYFVVADFGSMRHVEPCVVAR